MVIPIEVNAYLVYLDKTILYIQELKNIRVNK